MTADGLVTDSGMASLASASSASGGAGPMPSTPLVLPQPGREPEGDVATAQYPPDLLRAWIRRERLTCPASRSGCMCQSGETASKLVRRLVVQCAVGPDRVVDASAAFADGLETDLLAPRQRPGLHPKLPGSQPRRGTWACAIVASRATTVPATGHPKLSGIPAQYFTAWPLTGTEPCDETSSHLP